MDYWPAKVCISGEELKLTGILCSSWGGGGTPLYGLCGDVPLDRVWLLFSGYIIFNRVCVLSYVLNRDLKWIVLSYTGLVFFWGGAFLVLNRVRISNPQRHPYTQTWV